MSEIILSISKEIGKLKGDIRHLWDLSKQTPLNRGDCKNTILEIRKSLKVLWELIQDAILERLKELEFDKRLLFMIIAGKAPEALVKEAFRYPAYESEISSVISRLDSPEYYKDKEVIDSISRLVESLEAELNKFQLKLGLNYGILKISEFLATFPQFTENWTIAVCYLSAMEIIVKNKLKELGLDIKEFKDNYERLLRKLKEKGLEVSELERRLPPIFWDIRNKVIHEGYSPSFDELEVITKYVEKVLMLLKDI